MSSKVIAFLSSLLLSLHSFDFSGLFSSLASSVFIWCRSSSVFIWCRFIWRWFLSGADLSGVGFYLVPIYLASVFIWCRCPILCPGTSCSLARTSTAGPWFVSKNVFVLVYLLVFPLAFLLVFLCVFLLGFLLVFLVVFVFVFLFSIWSKQPCKDVYSRSLVRPAADVSKSIGMSNWFGF